MRSYLQLTLLALILFQSCRPTTGDSSATAAADSIANRDSTSQETDSTTTNGKLMQGEVGSSGDFMIAAAEGGLTEVKLAELALERSTNKKIKEYAQMMLKDHNAANVELMKLAQEKSVELPSSLCMECEATYNALAKRKGADFDSTYMQLMKKDHKQALEKFVFQSQSGGDEEVKQWAAKKVPTLQHHLDEAHNWQRTDASGSKPSGS